MAKRKKTAQQIFEENASAAANIIVDLMKSEDSSNSLKADLAKEVLTRVYGKVFTKEENGDLAQYLPDFFKELSK
ncbi:MAG: hypothetical protein IJ938_04680 [Clostridia bacterium]|nr:hypothetical protein [Clostridia bacterium]MBR2324258.1 hypothetical protein [Clostridia bacterium]MBR2495884.1 hypothetical protein [Clostridia bacterium]MBR6692333.1 hypothetical protein [Clostridia bacterium]